MRTPRPPIAVCSCRRALPGGCECLCFRFRSGWIVAVAVSVLDMHARSSLWPLVLCFSSFLFRSHRCNSLCSYPTPARPCSATPLTLFPFGAVVRPGLPGVAVLPTAQRSIQRPRAAGGRLLTTHGDQLPARSSVAPNPTLRPIDTGSETRPPSKHNCHHPLENSSHSSKAHDARPSLRLAALTPFLIHFFIPFLLPFLLPLLLPLLLLLFPDRNHPHGSICRRRSSRIRLSSSLPLTGSHSRTATQRFLCRIHSSRTKPAAGRPPPAPAPAPVRCLRASIPRPQPKPPPPRPRPSGFEDVAVPNASLLLRVPAVASDPDFDHRPAVADARHRVRLLVDAPHQAFGELDAVDAPDGDVLGCVVDNVDSAKLLASPWLLASELRPLAQHAAEAAAPPARDHYLGHPRQRDTRAPAQHGPHEPAADPARQPRRTGDAADAGAREGRKLLRRPRPRRATGVRYAKPAVIARSGVPACPVRSTAEAFLVARLCFTCCGAGRALSS